MSPDLARLAPLAGHTQTKVLAGYAPLSFSSHLLFSEAYRDLPDKRCLFLLTDNFGQVILPHSRPEFIEAAHREIGLQLGVSLAETSCGTNAAALALHYREPAVVRGQQHYCRLFMSWSMVAAPLVDLAGAPLACVVLAAHLDAKLGEKLALVKIIARELQELCVMPRSYRRPRPDRHRIELTHRQREVLGMFAKGLSYKQIARELGVTSPRTVEEHLDAVREKLGAHSRRECIHKAISLSLLELSG